MVIFGGIQRIAKVASKLVPLWLDYIFCRLYYPDKNMGNLNINDYSSRCFTGNVAGGAIGSMIIIGVRRGLFLMKQELALKLWLTGCKD